MAPNLYSRSLIKFLPHLLLMKLDKWLHFALLGGACRLFKEVYLFTPPSTNLHVARFISSACFLQTREGGMVAPYVILVGAYIVPKIPSWWRLAFLVLPHLLII